MDTLRKTVVRWLSLEPDLSSIGGCVERATEIPKRCILYLAPWEIWEGRSLIKGLPIGFRSCSTLLRAFSCHFAGERPSQEVPTAGTPKWLKGPLRVIHAQAVYFAHCAVSSVSLQAVWSFKTCQCNRSPFKFGFHTSNSIHRVSKKSESCSSVLHWHCFVSRLLRCREWLKSWGLDPTWREMQVGPRKKILWVNSKTLWKIKSIMVFKAVHCTAALI